jgi:hypothetical protein
VQSLAVNDSHTALLDDPVVTDTILKIVAGESIAGLVDDATILPQFNAPYMAIQNPPPINPSQHSWYIAGGMIIDP